MCVCVFLCVRMCVCVCVFVKNRQGIISTFLRTFLV